MTAAASDPRSRPACQRRNAVCLLRDCTVFAAADPHPPAGLPPYKRSCRFPDYSKSPRWASASRSQDAQKHSPTPRHCRYSSPPGPPQGQTAASPSQSTAPSGASSPLRASPWPPPARYCTGRSSGSWPQTRYKSPSSPYRCQSSATGCS